MGNAKAGVATPHVVADAATVTVAANTPVELWLKPIDANGNAVALPTTTSVTLNAPASGQFRLSQDGASVTAPVSIALGTSQTAVWYVNAAPQTNLGFDGAAY